MLMDILYRLGKKPVIAAVRNSASFKLALQSEVDNLFFMGGSIEEIIHSVQQAKQADKGTFVHPDLIKGLSSTDKETVSFIADYMGADGIVSPKVHMIKEAKRAGLYGILHLFILDSVALENGLKLVESAKPDAVELMPGVVIKVIEQFAQAAEETPVIASGLIQTVDEVKAGLQAGATSLSISDAQLWSLTFEKLHLG